jgi:hypothetical protein
LFDPLKSRAPKSRLVRYHQNLCRKFLDRLLLQTLPPQLPPTVEILMLTKRYN